MLIYCTYIYVHSCLWMYEFICMNWVLMCILSTHVYRDAQVSFFISVYMVQHDFVYAYCVYVHIQYTVCARVYIYITCWCSKRRSIWRCHQKPERNRLSGQLRQKTVKYESWTALPCYLWSAKLSTDNNPCIWEAEAALACNTYMSCVVSPSGCVRAVPPVRQADVLTVSCPCPLCCEPGTPANVNLSGYNFEVRM